ncbi:MAG: hypothetical protein IJI45_14995 [Anaerolineaceae bacterium]|nr:hypothetical protein [Anaerolineaceae bacterium]
MEIFSGDAPEWRYAHAAPMWIDGLEKLGVLPKLQNYIRYAFTVHLGYTSLATMQAVLSKAVPIIMRENHVQEIIACGREYRCFEDFDYRDSQQKKAFYRRWYHMRTQHPQISLEGYQEDYEAKHNGEAWDVPDHLAPEVLLLGEAADVSGIGPFAVHVCFSFLPPWSVSGFHCYQCTLIRVECQEIFYTFPCIFSKSL